MGKSATENNGEWESELGGLKISRMTKTEKVKYQMEKQSPAAEEVPVLAGQQLPQSAKSKDRNFRVG
jgi:hypothetical protein